jgi:hypothetical protein
MAAGIAIAEAEPSRLWGTLREYFANTSALDASQLDPNSNELIKAAIECVRFRRRWTSALPTWRNRLSASNAR